VLREQNLGNAQKNPTASFGVTVELRGLRETAQLGQRVVDVGTVERLQQIAGRDGFEPLPQSSGPIGIRMEDERT
jgi:hypothetical protein